MSASMMSLREELEMEVEAKEHQYAQELAHFKNELSKVQQQNLDFWNERTLNEYEKFFEKFTQNHL